MTGFLAYSEARRVGSGYNYSFTSERILMYVNYGMTFTLLIGVATSKSGSGSSLRESEVCPLIET